MEFPREIVRSLGITNIEEVFQKNFPAHRKKDNRPKTQFEPKTIDQRDLIMSYAATLKKGANIDIVIPDILRVTAMKLNHHAFKLRQMSKLNANNDKYKELIRPKYALIMSKRASSLASEKERMAVGVFPTGQATSYGSH